MQQHPEDQKPVDPNEQRNKALENIHIGKVHYVNIKLNADSQARTLREISDQAQNIIQYYEWQEQKLNDGAPVPESFVHSTNIMISTGSTASQDFQTALDAGKETVAVVKQALSSANVSGYYGCVALGLETGIQADIPAFTGQRLPLGEFRQLLESAAPQLCVRIDGVIDAIKNQGADWTRHAFASFRETVEELVRFLAPDKAVQDAKWYVANKDADRGVTRRQRLQFIATREGTDSVPQPIMDHADACLEQISGFQKGVHSTMNMTQDQVVSQLESAAWLFAQILPH